ncbi:hypothetical protein [Rhodococcus opacus]|uniref:hypothetical protein n=1 Tax=Rhodococcus opacus TaxID=37919 RepID=UPI001F0A49CA|nr:hypothetical protein [Rhodococcus opacus]
MASDHRRVLSMCDWWRRVRRRSQPLADVADDEIGETREALWGEAAVNAWNARRAAIASCLTFGAAKTDTSPRRSPRG